MAFTITTDPLYGQGGSYTARADRLHLASITRFGGVANATNANNDVLVGDLAVTTTGTGNGSVNVAAGHIWLLGAAGYGAYYAYNDSASVVGPLSANSSGNARLDLIVVRVSDTGVGAPTVALAVLTGTPDVVPVAPSVTVSSTVVEVPLASVYVPDGFTTGSTIVAGNIADKRTKHGLPNFAVGDTAGTTFVPSPLKGDLVYDALYDKWMDYTGSAYRPLQAGPIVCTSTTRPSSSARYAGMTIYETDTKRSYIFDGTAWVCTLAYGTYTPTLSGFNVGTGGSAKNLVQYSFSGKALVLQGSHVFGTSGTTFPGASITVTLPSDFTVDTSAFGTSGAAGVVTLNAGSDVYVGVVDLITSTTLRVQTQTYDPTGSALSYVKMGATGTSVPGTWAASDWIRWTATLYGDLA